jgi:N-methylhydantoinase B
LLIRDDGTEELLHSKLDHVKVMPGDLLLSDTWGGGGCGDPLERDPDKVKFDVDAGLVTVEGAKRYGVLLDAHGHVDAAATQALRATMAGQRGAVKLFDRGFESIEELKSRCLAETGLPPPEQPRFTKWALKAVGGKAA